MKRPAATADQRQAEYFLHLLTQICRRTNLRIDIYQKASAIADADGRAEYACGLRDLMRIEEQDRLILEGLIDHLQRRIPPDAPGEVPPVSRRALFVVR
jgi:hypothetical protein